MEFNEAMQLLLDEWDEWPYMEKIETMENVYNGFVKTLITLCKEEHNPESDEQKLIDHGDSIMKENLKKIIDFMEQLKSFD